MTSPTSVVEFLPPRQLESIAVSAPKPKRVKRIIPPEPEPSFPVVVTNLQDLPDDLLLHVFDFLVPKAVDTLHYYLGIVVVSEVSKYFLSLALSSQLWRRICVARWKTKVDFPTRLAQADSEARNDTADMPKSLIRGSYWYLKFRAEEEDASRTTITRSELHNTTFSFRLWFQSKLHPHMKRIKGALASGLDGRSVSDKMRFNSSGQIIGMPDPYYGMPYFLNEAGSIVNLSIPLDEGTDPLASLYVIRRKDWGWELRSQLYVIRSVAGDLSLIHISEPTRRS